MTEIEEKVSTIVNWFCMGMMFAATLMVVITFATRKTLDEHELYRFCLIKNIPLEECIIPKKPYRGEENDR